MNRLWEDFWVHLLLWDKMWEEFFWQCDSHCEKIVRRMLVETNTLNGKPSIFTETFRYGHLFLAFRRKNDRAFVNICIIMWFRVAMVQNEKTDSLNWFFQWLLHPSNMWSYRSSKQPRARCCDCNMYLKAHFSVNASSNELNFWHIIEIV